MTHSYDACDACAWEAEEDCEFEARMGCIKKFQATQAP